MLYLIQLALYPNPSEYCMWISAFPVSSSRCSARPQFYVTQAANVNPRYPFPLTILSLMDLYLCLTFSSLLYYSLGRRSSVNRLLLAYLRKSLFGPYTSAVVSFGAFVSRT